MRTTITISVEDVDFDTAACMLRVKGRNIQVKHDYVIVQEKDWRMITGFHLSS